VKALAHPLRVRILGVLEARIASPRELAEELGAPLGNVSYHVRQLAAVGLVKLVKETPRRGAVEHYYKLEARPSLTDEAWSGTPPVVKEALVAAVLGQISQQVNEGAKQGGFDRADANASRLPLLLDEKGFAAASRELEAVVGKLQRIEEASRKRLERAGDEGATPSLAVLMLFEHEPSRPQEELPKGRRRGGSPRRTPTAG